jgi:outer membrane protein assembly factor BamB
MGSAGKGAGSLIRRGQVAPAVILTVLILGLSTGSANASSPNDCFTPVCQGAAGKRTGITRTPTPKATRRPGAPSTSAATASPTDWATWGFDQARTGRNPFETALDPATVHGGLSQKWTFDAGAIIDTQPTAATGVMVNGSPKDLVFVGTEHGDFFAVNAQDGSVVWSRQGPRGTNGTLGSETNTCDDIPDKTYGVTAPPVLDKASNTLYVVGGDGLARALDMSTGVTKWLVTLTSDPYHEHVYGAPNLAGGAVYIPLASNCDHTPYHGRVVKIDVATQKIVATFNVVPTSINGGGVWGWGGVSADPQNVFSASGNAIGAATEHSYQAEHVTKLDYNLSVRSSNFPSQPTGDDDFGATPMLYQAPGCNPQLAVMKKHGDLYVYNRGSIGSGPLQSLRVDAGNGFLGVAAYDPTTNHVYVTHPKTSPDGKYQYGLLAFKVGSDCKLSLDWQQASSHAGLNSTPTLADGVVYYGNGFGKQLFAHDASNGTPLWNSGTTIGGAIVAAPTVVNGTVYAGSWDHKLYAFASLNTGRPTATTGSPSSVTQTSATVSGTSNPEGQATTYHFDYGTSTGYGQSAPVPDGSVGSDSSDHTISANLSGLSPGTTYHYRLVAKNAAGTTFGADQTFTTASSTAYRDAVMQTPGLVSYWRLGERSGTTAADEKNANPGSYVGSPTLGQPGALTGDSNTAVLFNGTSQQMSTNGPGLSSAGSLEGWFNWTGGVALMRDNTSAGGWILAYNCGGSLCYRLGGTTYNTGKPVTAVQNGWHHLAVTKDATGNVAFYIDGQQVHTASGAGSVAAAMPWHAMLNGLYTSQYTAGTADEVAVYNGALAASTVAQHYSLGKSG